MKDNKAIKYQIYLNRRQQGMSQEEMANRLGISLNAYRKIEKGETCLISKRIWAIAQIQGIAPEELVLDNDFESGMTLPDIEREKYLATINSLEEEIALLKQHIILLTERQDNYTRIAR